MYSSNSPKSPHVGHFGISQTFGFLPEIQPLKSLPYHFDAWELLAQGLPKRLAGDSIRKEIESLPEFPLDQIITCRERERAMVLLSYLGHAYVWSGKQPPTVLPAVLAKPWYQVAKDLGRPPVLSYASYCLNNWQVLDASREIEAGNIALIQNFFGGLDEEWFVLIHVDIEKRAAPAMDAIFRAQSAVSQNCGDEVLSNLNVIGASIREMNETLLKMTNFCDPYIYYHRVRPYIHGWKNHPDMPEGLIYEGVEEYGGQPQQFRGETGAQSSIVPALDALLGVEHEPGLLKDYLMEMRVYMPPAFQKFITEIENGPDLRRYVGASHDNRLIDAYNFALHELETFRSKHLEYAATYIFKQAQTNEKNPHAVGTGGTPFMPYLKKHRDETRQHTLNEN